MYILDSLANIFFSKLMEVAEYQEHDRNFLKKKISLWQFQWTCASSNEMCEHY